MEQDKKCYDEYKRQFEQNECFRNFVITNRKKNKLRFFGPDEWNRINTQNFVSPIPKVQEFSDLFALGYNIGNCQGTSIQLSYSYNDVDIVSGILPLLKGTLNSDNGGHCWLERGNLLIDTTLMLVMDISLKKELGYQEEQRRTSYDLSRSPIYQARRDFATDPMLKSKKAI